MKARLAMHRKTLFWFGLLMALDVAVWVLQKGAVRHAEAIGGSLAMALLKQPFAWSALLLAPLQLVLWMRVLSRTELSLAYPATSISYPFTMLAAVLLYHEKLSADVWIGAILITAGVWMLFSKSATPRLGAAGSNHDN